MTQSEIKMRNNQFQIQKKLVKSLLEKYRDVREKCGFLENDWHSRSIEKKAAPFLEGAFTLAVVGKVSSGKSTFINALLGAKDLLPTGHDQTTCGITYIEYGQNPEATIKFGDGHSETVKGENIREQIKKYVAIPEEFHDLPVNSIDDMILGGFDFNRIWKSHEQLEKETQCSPIDKNLLKKYVSNRTPKDIAVEIKMKYPFTEELKGWRIIDTPGIGAIGGIENRTKKLLSEENEDGSRKVDTIIFLQDGSQTLDNLVDKEFINTQSQSFTNEDTRRLFYVLTHSADSDFVINKEKKLKSANANFGGKIKRITYVDSLLYSFINDLDKLNIDLKYYDSVKRPENWSIEDWRTIQHLLFTAKQELIEKDATVNHETMLKMIKSLANFDELKKEINEYAKIEKENNIKEFINLVAKDYKGFLEVLNRDIAIVKSNIQGIQNAVLDSQENKRRLTKAEKDAEDKINGDDIEKRFSFISERLNDFHSLETENEVRTAITNLFDEVQKVEKNIFKELQEYFSEFLKGYKIDPIIIESVDFAAVTEYAEDINKEDYLIQPAKVKKHYTKQNKYIEAKYDEKKYAKEKFRRFKAEALKKARNQRERFQPQLKNKIKSFREKLFDELETKNNKEIEHIKKLQDQLGREEMFEIEQTNKINSIKKAGIELMHKSSDYGIKI